MVVRKPRYSMEEFSRRGGEIYEHMIRPKLHRRDKGKYVAIDIESGEYELSEDELTACDRLHERIPDSQTWLVRVGYRYTRHFGGYRRRERA